MRPDDAIKEWTMVGNLAGPTALRAIGREVRAQGLVVSVLTLAVALAKDGLVTKFRSLLPKMNLFAGIFLVVAGAYVAYYGYYEVRLFFFDGPVDALWI